MPLSPEDIQKLLSTPEKQRGGARKGTTGIGGKKVDTSKRDISTWFRLMHELFDKETNERVKCNNPNCVDPRDHSQAPQLCAIVDGEYMCRLCFLAGYGKIGSDQTQLNTDST